MTGEILHYSPAHSGWHHGSIRVFRQSNRVVGSWHCWNCLDVALTRVTDDVEEAKRLALDGIVRHRAECWKFVEPW